MRYTALLFCLISFLQAYPSLNPDVLNKADDKKKIIDTGKQQKSNYLYLSVGLNASKIDLIDHLKAEYETAGSSDSTAVGGEIGIGYKFYNWATTLMIHQSFLDNATISNYMFGANYFFDEKVYIGGLVGQSIFEWDNPPVINTIKEDKRQVKDIFGFEFGMEHPTFDKSFSLYTKYQLLFLDHKTNINNFEGVIQHKIENSLGVGVKYGF